MLKLQAHGAAMAMREYQKVHGIKAHCVDNTQFLSDALPGSKTVPCIVRGQDKSIPRSIVHLVVMYDNELIDPSYDTYSLSNKVYYMSIAEFRDNYLDLPPENLRWIIERFLSLAKIANDRHDNNELILTDEQYYNSLADWLIKTGLVFEY